MKKRIKMIIIIIIFIYIAIFIKKLLIKEHYIKYKVKKYNIEEYYYNKDKQYDWNIVKGKNNYQISINKDLHKKKRIIKDIKTYSSNNLQCILPIINNYNTYNLYCNLNNKQVSLYYLIDTNNNDFIKIQKKVKKYNIKYPTSKNTKEDYKKIDVYNKNILKEDTFIIWDYKGIYVLNNEENKYQKILDYDLYDNIMSTVVDKYYVLFENTSVSGIKTIYYYDLEKDNLKEFHPKTVLSKDSYINGVIGNKIYVTDNKKKKEYKIDIKHEKIEEIKGYIIIENGKEKQLTKSDFFLKKHYFYDEKTHYNYYVEGSIFYKELKTNKNNPILLLDKEVDDWKTIGDEIIFVEDNTLYSYTEENGLRKILENNELKYNYKNIYNCWKK